MCAFDFTVLWGRELGSFPCAETFSTCATFSDDLYWHFLKETCWEFPCLKRHLVNIGLCKKLRHTKVVFYILFKELKNIILYRKSRKYTKKLILRVLINNLQWRRIFCATKYFEKGGRVKAFSFIFSWKIYLQKMRVYLWLKYFDKLYFLKHTKNQKYLRILKMFMDSHDIYLNCNWAT